MATTALGPDPAQTSGDLPAPGSKAPDFTLVDTDLAEFSLSDLPGRTVISIFPSIGTGVCQASVRKFNELASGLEDTTVLNVSVDLPFALTGFCAAEGLEDVKVASAFRSGFGDDYGVRLLDTKFEGLLARAVVVVDTDGTVLHSELVPQIGQEPDYDAAVAALG
ncbi:thiol peroxidase, atypical 2-Cys peroxiredoxin [Nocardioides scoriae]|uniref:Thiol peroxidase, atypical 2-Cys peroxiredoxin n=1 Tax=Nocardioides scoriae TaxID=642780 RepID=A0A1H1Y2C0_9ACTN|nr:thiol peroxidase [Nocardioides scoriae]SDT15634.1 thiol peroxidase, atypical 2-Cys peroxiredoxin [Nocardioides scoriae]